MKEGSATTGYEYFANGSLKTQTLPNGVTANYTYFDNNKLHTLQNKRGSIILEAYQYAYDAAGNMTAKQDVKGTTTYTYTSINQLATVNEPTGKKTAYTYDDAGNRQTETITENGQPVTTAYEVNEQNRLMYTEQTLNAQTIIEQYFYDDAGNMTGRRPEVYTDIDGTADSFGASLLGQEEEKVDLTPALYAYNDKNQMVEAATGGSTVTNTFNAEGLRVSKTVDDVTMYYCYEYSRVIKEQDTSGSVAYNTYGANLISRELDGEKVYYIYNGHGDVTGLLSSSGTVIASYYYDSFGVILEESGSFGNPYRYAGYMYESELELYNLNARFMDAKLARFLSEDTYGGQLGDPLSLNRYSYCNNNPMIYYDPTGHSLRDIIAGVAAVVRVVTNAASSINSIASSIGSGGGDSPGSRSFGMDRDTTSNGSGSTSVSSRSNGSGQKSTTTIMTVAAALTSGVITAGEKIAVKIRDTTTEGLLINGTTYVGIRDLGEALGGNVNYNGATGTATITLNGKTVEIKTENGQQVVKLEGVTQTGIDCKLVDGKNMIPLRTVSNLLGVSNDKIFWDGTNKIAYVDAGMQVMLLYAAEKNGCTVTVNRDDTITVRKGDIKKKYNGTIINGRMLVDSAQLAADFGIDENLFRHEENDPFKRQDDAAMAFALMYHQRSSDEEQEYAATIDKNSKGEYYYTGVTNSAMFAMDPNNMTDRERNHFIVDYTDNTLGHIHTHWKQVPEDMLTREAWISFSGGDYQGASDQTQFMYLVNADGEIHYSYQKDNGRPSTGKKIFSIK